jgi:hypothetical protein
VVVVGGVVVVVMVIVMGRGGDVMGRSRPLLDQVPRRINHQPDLPFPPQLHFTKLAAL